MEEEKKKINYKGISSVIGGLCLHMVLGSNAAWVNVFTYMMSYLHAHDNNLKITDSFLFFSIKFGFFAGTFSLGGLLERKVGPKLVVLVSTVNVVIGYLILYFTTDFSVVCVSMIFFGISMGVGYGCPIRTALKHFPHKKGLVTGLVTFSYGLSSVMVNLVCNKIVNPDDIKVSKGSFYPAEVYKNVPKFFLVELAILGSLGLAAVILIFPKNNPPAPALIPIANQETDDQEKMIAPVPEVNDQPLRQAICSMVLFKIFLVALFTTFYSFFGNSTSKLFGNVVHIEESLLDDMMLVIPIGNALFRFLGGVSSDYISFKTAMSILLMVQIVLSALVNYTSKIGAVYFIYNFIREACFGAIFSVFPTFISRKFGVKNFSEIYGIVYIAFSLGSILASFIPLFVIPSSGNNIKFYYLIFYFIGCGLSVIALIILRTISLKKFVYIKGIQDQEKIVEENEKHPENK